MTGRDNDHETVRKNSQRFSLPRFHGVMLYVLALAWLCVMTTFTAHASEFYSYWTVAYTGGPSILTGIDSEVSINDEGAVAFVGFVPGGQAIFVGKDGFLTNLTPSEILPTVSFAPAVMLNNHGLVVGRKLVAGSGGAAPQAFIRGWNAINSIQITFASTGSGQPFSAVQNRAAVNDNGKVVFVGSDAGNPTQFRLATATGPGYNLSAPLPLPLRPRISNNGTVAVVAGSTLLLYDSTLSSAEVIASAPDFTALGRSPGISDNGQIITFYGDLSAAGAASLGLTAGGPGVFASIDIGTGSRRIVRIAGNPGDNLTFDPNSVVAVNSTQQTQRAVTVVYVATDTTTSLKGIYSSRLNFFGSDLVTAPPFNSDTPSEFSVSRPTLVIAEDESIPGFSDPVQSFNIFDPVNSRDRGDIAFWVQTKSGQQAVVRARYQQVVFIDFDPHGNFAASGPLQTQLITSKITGLTHGWAPGNMAGVLAASGRGFNAVDIQNRIVDLVQDDFDSLLPPGSDALGVNVRVLGRAGESPPTGGPYIRVFVGDGPYGPTTDPDVNCVNIHNLDCGTAGFASTIDLFNQISQPENWTDDGNGDGFCDLPTDCNNRWDPGEPFIDLNGNGVRDVGDFGNRPVVVFVDNIFRVSDSSDAAQPIHVRHAPNGDGVLDGMFYQGATPVPLSTAPPVAGAIEETQVVNAVATTISHEVGHILGLLHLDDTQNTLTMNQFINPNELRSRRHFGNASVALPEVPGDQENSGARLAFSVGSNNDVAPPPPLPSLQRNPPSAAVLASQQRTAYSMAAFAPAVPVTVIRAFIGIASSDQEDVFPQVIDLGSGDLATLLDREIPVRVGDKVMLLASTIGTTIDIFSVDSGFSGNVGLMDLSSALLVLADTRLRGDMFDSAGQPLASPRVGIYQITSTGPVLIGGNGPALILTPNVVGQPQADAEAALTAAGLSVGTVTTANSPTVPAGNVISQNPATGANVAPGSPVDLVVSLGPALVAVPAVTGLTQADAQAALLAAGLTVGTVSTAQSGTVPAGNVISQNPAAGANVAAGSPVNLVVSSGAAPPVQGDLDHDGDVDQNDVNILLKDRNKPVAQSACGTPCDLDGDGKITNLDARKLVLLCTRPNCATQ